jgi:hypothetical protein
MLWIVLGVLVLSVVILIVATVPVVRRLSGLRGAVAALRRRQVEALTLQQSLAQLRERLDTMAAR